MEPTGRRPRPDPSGVDDSEGKGGCESRADRHDEESPPLERPLDGDVFCDALRRCHRPTKSRIGPNAPFTKVRMTSVVDPSRMGPSCPSPVRRTEPAAARTYDSAMSTAP